MPAGRDIIDALECVLSVYFSNVRHRVRAAFLLCDEMVEMACKAKMKITHPTAGRIGFYPLLAHPSVNLDPSVAGLGQSLFRSHETRNHMQHANAAATVDDQHCADAILDAVSAIEHCFPGTSAALPDALTTALRVIRLQSSQGSQRHRIEFDDAMRKRPWNTPFRHAKANEPPVPVGVRAFWSHVITSDSAVIADILNRIGTP